MRHYWCLSAPFNIRSGQDAGPVSQGTIKSQEVKTPHPNAASHGRIRVGLDDTLCRFSDPTACKTERRIDRQAHVEEGQNFTCPGVPSRFSVRWGSISVSGCDRDQRLRPKNRGIDGLRIHNFVEPPGSTSTPKVVLLAVTSEIWADFAKRAKRVSLDFRKAVRKRCLHSGPVSL
jgi:hypothetical protein